jgi:hypothetical protein
MYWQDIVLSGTLNGGIAILYPIAFPTDFIFLPKIFSLQSF